MRKAMLINVTHSEESRVGIINEGVLESFEIESVSRAHLKGNIYKALVRRIHPALEAAFVDIGAERDAFLPLDEICFNNLETKPSAKANTNGASGKSKRHQLRVRDVLRPGQEILVQISKEGFANKPPTVSTFYSLPGRYLVLLPGSEDTGISRRIEGEERDRLRKVVDALKPDEGFGLIVRTVAGLENGDSDLARDLDYLRRLWSSVTTAANSQAAPSLVYREHDIVQRAIRDFYTPDIDEIHIDDEDAYQRAREFLSAFLPGGEAVLQLYRGEQPLFSAFKVEEQIDSVFQRRVRLRSGGSIVIDSTEALTAIDVNSGGAVRGANPEETAFRTNREAGREVARQLRLRDIGGIIVVDFIDMRDSRHNREIEKLVKDEMRIDKARHETSKLSSLGLMEISRQRLRPAATASSHATCSLCQGFGSIRTPESAALAAIRQIHNRLSLGDVESMRITLPTEVGLYLLNQKREDLAHLESRYESRVDVTLSDRLLPHEIESQVTERSRNAPRVAAIEPGRVAKATAKAATPEKASENGAAGKKRRRRRRRRSGARNGGEEGRAEASTEDAASSSGQPKEAAVDAKAQDGTRDSTAKKAAADREGAAQSDGEARGDNQERQRPRRSRGRRGGRRNRSGSRRAASTDSATAATGASPSASDSGAPSTAATPEPAATAAPTAPSATTGTPSSPSPSTTKKAATRKASAAKKTTRKAATKTTKKAATKKASTTKKTTRKTAKKATTKKAAARKTTKKSATKAPAKVAAKAPAKVSAKTAAKTTAKTTAKSTAKKTRSAPETA